MKKLAAKLRAKAERQELLNQIDALAGPAANEVLQAAIECAKNAVKPEQVEEVAHMYWIAKGFDLTVADVRAAGLIKGMRG